MKKLIALLVVTMLILINACALAQEIPANPFGFPGDDGRSAPSANAVSEAAVIDIMGRSVTVDFDPSPEFSYVKDGLLQASFYSYSADGVYLYELYMTFPESVTSGTTFTTEDAIIAGSDDCCIAVLVSTQNTEDYYLAAQYDGAAYPAGTAYSIRFDSVSDVSGGRRYTGVLSASMIGQDISGATIPGMMVLTEAPFSFTLPGSASGVQPYAGPTPVPGPTPTVRPDLFRI